MSSKQSTADAALGSMMNKRERIISMGYLAKSPSKSKDKAKHTMFWKLRWCVFAEVTYTDPFTFAEDSKLILYYYEDRDSHKRDVNSKGHLDISDCISINSCYGSQAGFDHIFAVRCPYGKFVKFSASSCRKKFIWLDILFRNKFNTNVQGVVRSKVISQSSKISRPDGGRSFDDLSGNVGTSTSQYGQRGKPRSVSLRHPVKKYTISPRGSSLKAIRTDSGTFSMSTVSSVSSDDEPPPLPPPRRRPSQESLPSLFEDQRSLCSEFSDLGSPTQEWEPRFPSREPSFSGGIGQRSASLGSKLQTADSALDEYFYCERCQKEAKKKRGSLTRRMSSKKRSGLKDDQHTHVEVEDNYIRPSVPATDYPLDDSFDSDELMLDENENKEDQIYVEIDDDWLDKVRRMTGSSVRVEAVNQTEIETDEPDGQIPSATANEDFPEDDTYQAMNLYTREYTPPLDQVEADLRDNSLHPLEGPRLRGYLEEDEYLLGEEVKTEGKGGFGCSNEATNNNDSVVSKADFDENSFPNQRLDDHEQETSDPSYDNEARNNIDNEINEVCMEKEANNQLVDYHGSEATDQSCDNEDMKRTGEEEQYRGVSDHEIAISGLGCNDEAINSINLEIGKAELIETETVTKENMEAAESHPHNEISTGAAAIQKAAVPQESGPRTDADEVSLLGLDETGTMMKEDVLARDSHLHNNEIIRSSATIKRIAVPQESEQRTDGDCPEEEEAICLDSYLQGLNENKQRFHGRLDLSGISEHYDTAL